eukprot:COSAG06_NODE_16235_length_1011_cov_11.220395_1_plen_274_part_10
MLIMGGGMLLLSLLGCSEFHAASCLFGATRASEGSVPTRTVDEIAPLPCLDAGLDDGGVYFTPQLNMDLPTAFHSAHIFVFGADLISSTQMISFPQMAPRAEMPTHVILVIKSYPFWRIIASGLCEKELFHADVRVDARRAAFTEAHGLSGLTFILFVTAIVARKLRLRALKRQHRPLLIESLALTMSGCLSLPTVMLLGLIEQLCIAGAIAYFIVCIVHYCAAKVCICIWWILAPVRWFVSWLLRAIDAVPIFLPIAMLCVIFAANTLSAREA